MLPQLLVKLAITTYEISKILKILYFCNLIKKRDFGGTALPRLQNHVSYINVRPKSGNFADVCWIFYR